ncbi:MULTISPECIES: hypothetical protein [Microbacterium]|uniref:hypothetical protein n=1 Tax=Microbacterium TaxID=33882 RepID=UPI000D6447E6|nr:MULTISPECIES: hypothetical protein [Microbacterium]
MPVAPDWTIGELLAWIAADEARSHDEALRPALSALAAGLDSDAAPGLTPRSPIALVRAVGARVRSAPLMRDRTLGSVTAVAGTLAATGAGFRTTGRGAEAGPPASVPAVLVLPA